MNYMMNKQRKVFKKEIIKELMVVAWQHTKWWDCCMSEVEKKEVEPIFTDKNSYNVCNMVIFLKSAMA